MYLWAAKAIAGSLLGAATSTYIKKTKFGKWLYKKYESIVAWAAERYGVDILDPEDVKLHTAYPQLRKQIKELEKRIQKLEGKK